MEERTMEFANVIASVGAALNLAAWGALFAKLRALPLSVAKAAQRDRVADEKLALDVLQAAAASRVAGLVIGLQRYHEQLGGLVRAQLADAEVRARVSERRSSDAAVALSAASVLVRELRGLLNDAATLMDCAAARTAPDATSPRTGLSSGIVPAPVPQEGEDRLTDDDLTHIGSRPLSGAVAVDRTLLSTNAGR
jgi:hypothetical protein